MTSANRIEAFGRTLARLYEAIDWEVVATVYVAGDASGFFDQERRDAVMDAGLKLASDLGDVLKPGGRSLYVGAAVAELVPMLYESIVLERKVRWVTLGSVETKELARAIKTVDGSLPRPWLDPFVGREISRCDHVWMTSVLTDPDSFPALHDKLYQRQGTTAAVGGGRPKAERAKAQALIEEVLEAVGSETTLTTTDEELEVWKPIVQRRGGHIDVPRTGRTSPIVGDVVRLCRLVPGSGRR